MQQVGFKPGVREGVINEQNGESKYEAMMGDGIGESDTEKLDWHQNEVDEEMKGVGSRDQMKHNEKSDQLLLERIILVVEQE